MARQADAIGTGSLNADSRDRPEGSEPLDEIGVAGLGRGERLDAEHAADIVDGCSDMNINVGVDPSGDRTQRLYDGHGHPFALNGQGVARTCRTTSSRVTSLAVHDGDLVPGAVEGGHW